MPSKKKPAAAGKAALPPIPRELIDQFVKGPMSAEAVQAASMAFKKALIERALAGELSLRIEVPRDRDGSFEPVLIPKHERRFTGFDDKIVAMYARGMTISEIQGFLPSSTAPRSAPSSSARSPTP